MGRKQALATDHTARWADAVRSASAVDADGWPIAF